jgi:hypothetical protein
MPCAGQAQVDGMRPALCDYKAVTFEGWIVYESFVISWTVDLEGQAQQMHAFDGSASRRFPKVEASFTAGSAALHRQGAEPLAFVHIPKTAGSSLYAVFRTLLRPTQLIKLHPEPLRIDAVERLPARRRRGIKLLYGHIDVDTTVRFVPIDQCVTLLREPVDRMVSFYYFVRSMSSGPLHELARRHSIIDWMDASRSLETDNGMVRRLAGSFDEVPYGACTPELLTKAKANLARFAVVGLTDRFDEFYAMLAARMGCEMRAYSAANVNRARPRLDSVPREVLDELMRRNALDLELFSFGQTLFSRQRTVFDVSAALERFRRRSQHPLLRLRDNSRRIAFAQLKRLRHNWRPHRLYG